jgi:ribosomal subunit interface protein
MDIQINAIHFDITQKLNDFIVKKIERLVRHYSSITSVNVSLRVVKPETAMNKQAIIVAAAPLRDDIAADKTADSFEEAVDLCLEAISRQLEKIKNKNRPS